MSESIPTNEATFDEWAIVELMGHRRLAGRLREQTLGGAAMLRLDVPGGNPGGGDVTHFYSASAIYCITPCGEELARRVAAEMTNAGPVSVYEFPELRQRALALDHVEGEGDDDDLGRDQ